MASEALTELEPNMVSQDEIFGKVQSALVEALGVDEDEVKPDATLQGDLNAESIDFLDIIFRLEKAFEIKIPRGELFPDNVLTDPNYVVEGKFTPQGLTELRKRMPFADLDHFASNPKVQSFGEVFTVKMICDYIQHKLQAA